MTVKFLKLTESCSNGIVRQILVNAAQICFIQQGDRAKDTYIGLVNSPKYYFVKESVADIWIMMNVDYCGKEWKPKETVKYYDRETS